MDLSGAYWQLRLAEESQGLTTFICPRGRFVFTRLPMGVNCSSDLFNGTTDKILYNSPGLDNFAKEVDDILLYASTEEGVLDQFEALL